MVGDCDISLSTLSAITEVELQKRCFKQSNSVNGEVGSISCLTSINIDYSRSVGYHTCCVWKSRHCLSAYTEYKTLNGADGGNIVSRDISSEQTSAVMLLCGGNATRNSKTWRWFIIKLKAL